MDVSRYLHTNQCKNVVIPIYSFFGNKLIIEGSEKTAALQGAEAKMKPPIWDQMVVKMIFTTIVSCVKMIIMKPINIPSWTSD
jgi:hypothetical protein